MQRIAHEPPGTGLEAAFRAGLEAIVGPRGVIWQPGSLAAYEQDGFLARGRPLAVCLPETTDQVSALLRVAAERGLPVTPRGAGTGLSGGATPAGGGLVVGTSRMNRILRLDPDNLLAVVQPGVVNLDLSRAAESYGLYYAPDPSSQSVSTIGGNVAENAGGAHCLKYGVTTNHVLGMEVVLADGTVVHLGASACVRPDQRRTTKDELPATDPGFVFRPQPALPALSGAEGSGAEGSAAEGSSVGPEAPGYDLAGLVTGSEGNLAFVTAITVRLLRRPESVRTLLAPFDSALAAGAATSAIIAGGVIPAALEYLDAHIIDALRQGGFHDYPAGAQAVLLVELDGLEEQTAEEAARVETALLDYGAAEVRVAATAAERSRLWAGRKGALGACGRLAPNYYIQDGVVPRSRIVAVLAQVDEVARREGLLIVNVFHAGDGNLHPTILYDARIPGLTERVIAAGEEILRACIAAGGTLSGEHGIGLEKQPYLDWVYAPADQDAQRAVKRAFDPHLCLNPGKPFSGPVASTAHRLRPQAG